MHQSIRHVAVIMDGNGRWAENEGVSRKAGHEKGAERAREIVKAAAQSGIPYLTLYTFSSENWNRSDDEISDLMGLLRFYLRKELKKLHSENIKICIIGNRHRLDPKICKELEDAENLTQNNNRMTLNMALSYGARQEIISAFNKILDSGIKSGVTAEMLSNNLDTADQPDPDLVIRTGGDQRLSNFLLWQIAYAELYFTDILWPDFTEADFLQAIGEFGNRERRFGGRKTTA